MYFPLNMIETYDYIHMHKTMHYWHLPHLSSLKEPSSTMKNKVAGDELLVFFLSNILVKLYRERIREKLKLGITCRYDTVDMLLASL